MDEAAAGHHDSTSGQAAIESALTLPLMVFLMLGTLQLFLMLQARTLAEYSAFWAVRSGSVNHGECARMLDAAVVAVLPAITRTYSPQTLAQAFGLRRTHTYDPRVDGGRDGSIVWIQREQPTASALPLEELDFDAPSPTVTRLEVRLVFWFPMQIPFANWVMARMFLAHFGLRQYTAINPLSPAAGSAKWAPASPAQLDQEIATELTGRVDRRQYVFPIIASWSMRMMTPARRNNFLSPTCK